MNSWTQGSIDFHVNTNARARKHASRWLVFSGHDYLKRVSWVAVGGFPHHTLFSSRPYRELSANSVYPMLRQLPPATSPTMRPANSRPGGFYSPQSLMEPFTTPTTRQHLSTSARPRTSILHPLSAFPHSSKRFNFGLMDLLTLQRSPGQRVTVSDTSKSTARQVSSTR